MTQATIGALWKRLGSVLLFTLLGASIDQSKLDGGVVGMGFVLIIIGLIDRSIATIISVLPIKSWVLKEKAFAVITWCPKATVQAALASKALDHLNERLTAKDENFWTCDAAGKCMEAADVATWRWRSEIILTCAVLSIIMTAPTFAVLMAKFGPILLSREGATDIEIDGS